MMTTKSGKGKNVTQPEPVAIIGMGCLFPKAEDPEVYWANINNKVDGISDIPESHWHPEDYYNEDPSTRDHTYAKRGGFISPVDFNPMEYGISPRDIEAIDTTQLLGMVVARQALDDAGYGGEAEFDRKRTSVILGVTGALELVITLGTRLGFPVWKRAMRDAGLDKDTADDIVSRISDSYVDWQENSFPGLLGNVAAGRIANRLDLGGTNCVVDAACASSLTAMHMACLELDAGRADMVVTGGLDTFNDIFMYMCFSKTPALSPTGNSKPFAADGDGTILGEGLGVLVLKRLEDATRDGDKVYAVIRGVGSSSDGKGNAVYAPSADGQVRALEEAYEMAQVSPATIELVEAHGTGTRVGDAIEVEALTRTYQASGREGTWCALGSVKSQIGHTKAAAGVAGVIKAALALHHKVLPPTMKVDQPLELLAATQTPFYVNTSQRPWLPPVGHPRRAAVSAFGFGGSNFHCVLEEYKPVKDTVDWDGNIQVLAFSANTRDALAAALTAWPADQPWKTFRHQAAANRAAFNPTAAHRLTMVIENGAANIGGSIKKALAQLKGNTAATWQTPDGVYYCSTPKPGKLGFVFSGQGSQYGGMLREIACRFPQMQEVLAEANAVFEDLKDTWLNSRLSDYIYPHPEFSDAERERNQAQLQNTRVAQPAIGAIGLGMSKVLAQFGINADALAGHSYGELVALCASGVYKDKVLHKLSVLRGQLMDETGEIRSGMLAVRSSIEKLMAVIKSEGLDLIVANKNAPNQTVLSGAVTEIEKAIAILKEKRIHCKQLNVSAAFHSNWVENAKKPFMDALKKIRFSAPRIPVYATSTGTEYPQTAAAVKALLSEQLVRPVEFIQQIQTMYEEGVRTFVEVGPASHLTGMIKSILEEKSHSSFAIDSFTGRRSSMLGLGLVLAQLASLGYAVDLGEWDGQVKPEPSEKPGFTVSLNGANYVQPKTKAPSRAVAKSVANRPRMSAPPEASSHLTEPQPNVSVDPLADKRRSNSSQPGIRTDMNTPTHTAGAFAAVNAPSTAGLPAASNRSLTEALKLTQQNMIALQQIQTQTAELHGRFLSGQETAQHSLNALIEQQQQLLRTFGGTGSHAFADVPAPAPAVMPQSTSYSTPPSTREPTPAPVALTHAAPMPETVATGTVQSDSQTVGTSPLSGSRIEAVLFEVISEKTGYPVETLSLDMGLDADLGIDSIKRVEILSALQEKLPEAPPVGPEQLGALHTLGHIVGYLGAGNAEAAPGTQRKAKAQTSTGVDKDRVSRVLLDVVADKTGYPVDSLSLEMGLDSDLGIDSIKRVEILSELHDKIPEAPQVGPEHLGVLKTLSEIVEFLTAEATGTPTESSESSVVAAPARAHIESVLVAVVADKTGYPAETLTMDMGMDADLGIDSIKRVEILSELHERLPEAPQVGPEHLGTLSTLGEIVGFLAAEPGQGAATTGGAEASSAVEDGKIRETLLQVVSEKTGYPVDMLSLEMGLDADLGIDSIKRVEILSALQEALPGTPAVGPEQLGELHTLEHIVDYLSSASANTAPVNVAGNASVNDTQPATENTATAIERLVLQHIQLDGDARHTVDLAANARIWITDDASQLAAKIVDTLANRGYESELISTDDVGNLAIPDDLSGLLILSPKAGADNRFLKNAFMLLQQVGPVLRKRGQTGSTVVATVSRLDGVFGINGLNGISDPLSGGLAGMSKTASHEWPEVHCKAIDLEPPDPKKLDDVAIAIADELLTIGPVEVGISAGGRQSLELALVPLDPLANGNNLQKNDVVLISGGARGITAEVAVALARKWQPTLVLFGRSAIPRDEPAWLSKLDTEGAIKGAIVKRAKTKMAPKEIENRYRKIAANREIRSNLQRIEAAGSTVIYKSVDVRNHNAVKKAVNAVVREHGTIRGLIHGAGVLADRRIEEKTPEQFELVYSTKVDGQMALLAAVNPKDLKFMALFSSTTGRYGRTGQIDYAVANEVLNKIAQQQARSNAACRVVAFNWGPWDGGMVTPSLKKVFESEKVGLIPLEAGAEFVVRELGASGSQPTEIVVLGAGSSGLDARSADKQPENTVFRVTMERTVSIDEIPVLASHVIDNQGVLPMALIVEWLAQGAIHNNPGLKFGGFTNLQVHKRVAVNAVDQVRLRLETGPIRPVGDEFRVPVRLCLVSGSAADVQSEAEICLRSRLEAGRPQLKEPELNDFPANGNIYESTCLFHGKDFFGIDRIDGFSSQGIVGWCLPAPAPAAWIKSPIRQKWLSDPLALDSSLQMIILWSEASDKIPALPTAIAGYRQFQTDFPIDGVRTVICVTGRHATGITADIEFLDRQGQLVARAEGCRYYQDKALLNAFRKNTILYNTETAPA